MSAQKKTGRFAFIWYTLMKHLLVNFGYPLIFFSYQTSKVAICDVKVNKGHYLNQMTLVPCKNKHSDGSKITSISYNTHLGYCPGQKLGYIPQPPPSFRYTNYLQLNPHLESLLYHRHCELHMDFCALKTHDDPCHEHILEV